MNLYFQLLSIVQLVLSYPVQNATIFDSLMTFYSLTGGYIKADGIEQFFVESGLIDDYHPNTNGWKKSKNWGTIHPFDTWHGISFPNIDEMHIELFDNQLRYKIPFEPLANLNLHKLDLYANNFNQSISSDIGLLNSLTHLQLSGNNFGGEHNTCFTM